MGRTDFKSAEGRQTSLVGSTPTLFRHRLAQAVNYKTLAHSAALRQHLSMAQKLNSGEPFPKMTLKLVDGSTLELPDGLDAKYKVILFYRGHW